MHIRDFEQGRFQVKHCYRDSNYVAEMLVTIRAKSKQEIFFTEAISLLRQVKTSLKRDQECMPNLRIKLKKNQFNFDHRYRIVIIYCLYITICILKAHKLQGRNFPHLSNVIVLASSLIQVIFCTKMSYSS